MFALPCSFEECWMPKIWSRQTPSQDRSLFTKCQTPSESCLAKQKARALSKIVVLERDSYSKGVTMPRLQCLQLNLLKASGCTASKWWYQWNKLHFKKLGWKSSCLLSNTIHLEAVSSTVLPCRSHHSWHQVVLCHLFLSSTCEDFPQNRRAYLELQLGKGPINQRTYCICQWVPISLNQHWI